MRRKGLKVGGVLLAALVAALAGLFLLGKRGPSPEAEVRKVLAEIEREAEGLEFGRVLRFVSLRYADPAGNTYLDLRRAAFRARREVAILFVSVIGGWRVEVEGGKATAKGRVFYYVLSRTGEADRDWLDLTVHLGRERGGWKVYRVDGLPRLE